MDATQSTLRDADAELLPHLEANLSGDESAEDAAALVLELPSPPEQFSICDEASAAWLVRKITEARAYAAKVRTWAEREERRALREEQFFMERYGAQLSAWCRGEIAKLKGRRKSVNLPSGSVGFRSAEPKLVIDDEQTVLAWAKESCTAAVVTTERVSKSELNRHFEATGEIPPEGAHVEPARESFYVK